MSSTTTIVILLLAPVLIFSIWHLTVSFVPSVPSPLQGKRIILLIAHPDDESMFFSPTLQALTSPDLRNHVKILCMSTGNSDGIGETRRKELEKAAVALGVRRREDVFVLDDARFKDGMKEKWDPLEIARVLASAFAPHLNVPPTSHATNEESETKTKEKANNSKSRSKSKHSRTPSKPQVATPSHTPPAAPEGPRASIDVLITFDRYGISDHPNHKALYDGATAFLKQIMHGHSGYACPVDLFVLSSVNMVRKYSFILDAIPTMLAGVYGSMLGNVQGTRGGTGRKDGRDRLLFVNDVSRYWKAREAMTQGHQSQMVWFRWGWIGVGRYMVVNDLKRERIIAT